MLQLEKEPVAVVEDDKWPSLFELNSNSAETIATAKLVDIEGIVEPRFTLMK